MIQVKQTIRFSNGTSGRRKIAVASEQPQTTTGRVPRISKLMALAIRFDGLLRLGVVKDQTELDRLAKVTQPRRKQADHDARALRLEASATPAAEQ